MKKKVIVTGGAGYIGSHTCLELLKSGCDILVYDNLSNGSKDALRRVELLAEKKLKFVQGDMRDTDFLLGTLREFQPDAALHFAGLKAVGESVLDPIAYYDVNVTGTINLLAAMSDVGCCEIVFSSSASVYGNDLTPPFSEKDQVLPISPYGRTKHISEMIIKDWVEVNKTHRAAVLRYFNPVGAHESGLIGEDPKGEPNNLMPIISAVAEGNKERLSVYGDDYATKDGSGERDYIHVVDLAIGHVKSIVNIDSMDRFQILNLGTGMGTTVIDLIKTFKAVSGIDIPYEITSRRPGDVAVSLADPSAAQEIIKFSCSKTVENMCADVWAWRTKNPNGYRN